MEFLRLVLDGFQDGADFIQAFRHDGVEHRHGPVSYTHLDVYKRQHSRCVTTAGKDTNGFYLVFCHLFPAAAMHGMVIHVRNASLFHMPAFVHHGTVSYTHLSRAINSNSAP